MTVILFAFIIFLSLIQWVVFIDVILSWGPLVWIRFRPLWIMRITIPLYVWVRRFVPTTIGGVDFTPIIIFIIIEFLSNLILNIDPSILSALPR